MYRFCLSLVMLVGLVNGGCRGPRYGQHEAFVATDTVDYDAVLEAIAVPAAQTAPPEPTPAQSLPSKPPPAKRPAPLRPAPSAARAVRTPASVQQAGHPASAPWLPVAPWAKDRNLGTLQRISYSEDPVFELSTPGGTFVFQIHHRQATWNGMQVHLGFAPVLTAQEPCLHELDLVRTVEPLLQGEPEQPASPGVIVIDPGHGGGVSGTRSVLDRSPEKVYALDWALRLQPLLQAQGWTVLLTRTNDSDLALADRVAFAERARADLFISLHFNASGNGNHQEGVETYCLTPTGMPSTLKREFEDDASEVLPNNTYDEENLRLAAALHRALLDLNGGLDRGVRRARFMTVLRGQNRPAALIEGGYLSHPAEAARIADPAFRQRLAEAVARALEPGRVWATGRLPEFKLVKETPAEQMD